GDEEVSGVPEHPKLSREEEDHKKELEKVKKEKQKLQWEKFKGDWTSICGSRTVEEFDENYKCFIDAWTPAYKKAVKYCEKQWFKTHKEKFLAAWTNK
ncbi:hypothetical protein MKW92_020589, partial [Papaver armeniacum]